MRLIFEKPHDESGEEIIVRAHTPAPELVEFLTNFCSRKEPAAGEPSRGGDKLPAYNGSGEIVLLSPAKVLYFETVDERTFAYLYSEVFEVKYKLYELESLMTARSDCDFFRASRSVLLNISHIERFKIGMSGCEAILDNNERVLISRRNVPLLKERLGI